MPLIFARVLDWFTTVTTLNGEEVKATDWNPLFVLLSAMYLFSGACWLMVDCTNRIKHDDSDAQPKDVSTEGELP